MRAIVRGCFGSISPVQSKYLGCWLMEEMNEVNRMRRRAFLPSGIRRWMEGHKGRQSTLSEKLSTGMTVSTSECH